jgi:aspartate kinase
MSGTTNALVEISEQIRLKDKDAALILIQRLASEYQNTIQELLNNNALITESQEYVNQVFTSLIELVDLEYTNLTYSKIVAQGELLSTFLFSRFLTQEGIKATLLPALEYMRIDQNNDPDSFYIKQNLDRLLIQNVDTEIYITQGFICLDVEGHISNLKRGGSDYTASIIGAATKAEEVQIWTDIDGFHNNDPRFVENTTAISNISFDEAAELAYFGAKILHPQTVMPVRDLNIPVRLKNTMSPDSYGTLITQQVHGEGIKAIAAKDGIYAIKIKSARMLQAHGFLKRVFEVFEKYETPIDMITTSEIAVSLTIDNPLYLDHIVLDLEKIASVEVDKEMSIVCLVGNNIIYHQDTPRLFQILQDVSVRMIAYGGSNNNISLLINTSDKQVTLGKLQDYVFKSQLNYVTN